MKALALLAVLLLAGCSHAAWKASGGAVTAGGVSAGAATAGSGALAVFGLVVIAAGIHGTADEYGSISSRPPEMAPDRKIQEVDCSKPFDPSLGNIRCK